MRQVGQHVAHQRRDRPAACRRCGDGARGACACASAMRISRGGAEHAVQPGEHHHLEDGGARRAPPSPTRQAQAPCELDFGRCVGPVAELVLQPHDAQRVALPSGPPARQQEAGQPARRLRQHQEAVGHRRREEPLVADQLRTRRRRPAAWRRVVLARTSLPPCFSVMPMPMVTPRLSRDRRRRAGRSAARPPWRPIRRSAGAWRSAGIAAWVIVSGQLRAGFDLVVQVAQRRARDMRARALAATTTVRRRRARWPPA